MSAVPADLIEPERLAKLDDLELLAATVVSSSRMGIHRGPRTGNAIEFAQYRPYVQGDDPRYLDWKLYARSDRLHLKQFREESGMRATLLLDCSASMAYASGAVTKFHYAKMLAACLAAVLDAQGDAVGFGAYHEEMLEYRPATRYNGKLRRLFTLMEGIRADAGTDTAGALSNLGEMLKPRGMVVLISDLLYPLEQVVTHLRGLRARRHDVLVLQISDPAEQDFPFDGTVNLIDLEGGDERLVVPDEVREAYLENRNKHFDTIQRECRNAEIDIVELTCNQPLDMGLRHFLNHRKHALKTGADRGRR